MIKKKINLASLKNYGDNEQTYCFYFLSHIKVGDDSLQSQDSTEFDDSKQLRVVIVILNEDLEIKEKLTESKSSMGIVASKSKSNEPLR